MKTKFFLGCLLLSLSPQTATLFAQGSLTPPAGAPAPTMKSLDQIDAKLEKRTPISSAPYTISQPGSYYLTGNVTATTGDAITVASNGVTIDLNGFTISSTSATASGTAILLGNNIHDVTIRNGHIVSGTTVNGSNFTNGPGFVHGIRYTTNSVYNVLISDVTVSGCNSSGIDLAFGQTVVESCTVSVAGGYGITASTIRNCTAANTGLTAIYSNVVSGSFGSQVGPTNYYGVFGQSVINCYGISNAGFGIYGYSVLNSYGQTSTGTYGILGETIVGFCYGTAGGTGHGIGAINFAYACGGFPNIVAGHQYFCGSGPNPYP